VAPLLYAGILLLMTFAFLFPASAQIVNIEKERIKKQDSIGMAGKISATLNITQNKTLLINADLNPHLQYKGKKHLILALAQSEYAALDSKTINSGGFVHLRHNYSLYKNIKSDVFTQLQYNKVWNMPLRFLLGGGPRIKVLDYRKNRLYFGPLYMYEIQEVQAENFVQHNHRMSAYLSWNIELNAILFFSGTVYYQPLLKNFENYRLTGMGELNIAVSRHFSFDNRFMIIFDQTGTTDVPARTYRYTAGLGYKF
jgi:hypothetical protein